MPIDEPDHLLGEPPPGAFVIRAVVFAAAIAVVVILWLWFHGSAEGAEVRNQLALAKCRLVVRECYPNSGFYPWCGTLIAEHEKREVPGFAAAWWYSLVYGGANAKLKVGAVFPGNCAGPMDVRAYPLVLEPGANIRHHTDEMWLGYRKGYRDRRLAEYVMLPSAPRDWGGGRFKHTDARHRSVIRRAYKEGKLP